MALFHKKGPAENWGEAKSIKKYQGFEYLIMKLSFPECHETPARCR